MGVLQPLPRTSRVRRTPSNVYQTTIVNAPKCDASTCLVVSCYIPSACCSPVPSGKCKQIFKILVAVKASVCDPHQAMFDMQTCGTPAHCPRFRAWGMQTLGDLVSNSAVRFREASGQVRQFQHATTEGGWSRECLTMHYVLLFLYELVWACAALGWCFGAIWAMVKTAYLQPSKQSIRILYDPYIILLQEFWHGSFKDPAMEPRNWRDTETAGSTRPS